MTTDPALAALARVRAAVRRTDRRPVVRPPRLTAAGPDDRDPQELGALLDGWVRGTGATADLAVAGLAARWARIVGPQVAAHTTVGEYQPHAGGGDLVVHADSGEWAVQLRYLTDRITERIAAEIGPGLVSRISVRGPQRSAGSGGWRVRTGRRSPRVAPVVPPPPDTLDLG